MALSDNVSRLIDITKRLREIAVNLNDVESKSKIIDELFLLQELREQDQSGEGAKTELREPEKKQTLAPIGTDKVTRLEPSDGGETYTISLKEEETETVKSEDAAESKTVAQVSADESGDVETATVTRIEPPSPTVSDDGEVIAVETFGLKSETESEMSAETDTVIEKPGSKSGSKQRKKKSADDEPIEIIEEEIEIIEDDIEVIEEDIEVIDDDFEIIEDDVEFVEDFEIIEKKKAPTKKQRALSAEKRIQKLEPLQQAALKKLNDILNPDQVKKKVIAGKAAKKAGKKGSELQQYVMSHLDLSDKQKTRMAAAAKELHKIRLKIAAEVEHLLDDQQKARVKLKR